MKKINIRRIYYLARHKYFTLNNGVIVIAFMIVAGWVWGSLGVMQRNYNLQKELDDKSRQLLVAQLEKSTLEFQQHYYRTNEYKELAVREKIGLATPGESVLILPPNSETAKNADKITTAKTVNLTQVSNLDQWINFLFGNNNHNHVS